MIPRPLVAVWVAATLGAACGGTGPGRPAAHAPSPSPSPSVAPHYPDLGQPVNRNSAGEALLAPSQVSVACDGDRCTVSALLTNQSDRARMSGRLAVTLVDKLTSGILGECYARPAARLDPTASAEVSCPLDRKPTAGRAEGSVEIDYAVDEVSFSL